MNWSNVPLERILSPLDVPRRTSFTPSPVRSVARSSVWIWPESPTCKRRTEAAETPAGREGDARISVLTSDVKDSWRGGGEATWEAAVRRRNTPTTGRRRGNFALSLCHASLEPAKRRRLSIQRIPRSSWSDPPTLAYWCAAILFRKLLRGPQPMAQPNTRSSMVSNQQYRH